MNIKNMTERQYLRQEAKRQARRIIADLSYLADRLDQIADRFDQDDEPAADIVACMVKEHMQQTGAAGAAFWSLIRELGQMPD